jgi:hypothetical protein
VIDVVGALPSTIRESKRGFDMNWARGLFRSWLVAASLWCSIIGVISHLEYGSHESAIATSTSESIDSCATRRAICPCLRPSVAGARLQTRSACARLIDEQASLLFAPFAQNGMLRSVIAVAMVGDKDAIGQAGIEGQCSHAAIHPPTLQIAA